MDIDTKPEPDVDLDDLYGQAEGADTVKQEEGELADADMQDAAAPTALTHEQLLEQLRCGSSCGCGSSGSHCYCPGDLAGSSSSSHSCCCCQSKCMWPMQLRRVSISLC